jgi:hypothetical protein
MILTVLWAMEGWLREMRFLERRLRKVIGVLIFRIIFFVISTNLTIKLVGGSTSLTSNYLDDALEAVTFCDVFFEVVQGVLTDCSLLLEDQIFEFL